jgi:hypothetical protein
MHSSRRGTARLRWNGDFSRYHRALAYFARPMECPARCCAVRDDCRLFCLAEESIQIETMVAELHMIEPRADLSTEI